MKKDRGFTLVELLVVIGIIALLVSILIPALNKARQHSKAAACMSNLRQIGIGFFLYAHNNKGVLMPRSEKLASNPVSRAAAGMRWYEFLGEQKYLPEGWVVDPLNNRGYVTGVWRCPEVADDELVGFGGSFSWGGGYGIATQGSNGMFRYWDSGPAGKRWGGPKLSRVKRSSERWLIGDSGRLVTPGREVWLPWAVTFGPNPNFTLLSGSGSEQPARRHARKANVCFFDGHVEPAALEELNVPFTSGKNKFFATSAECDNY